MITIFVIAIFLGTLIPVVFLSVYHTGIDIPTGGGVPKLSINDASLARDNNGSFVLSFGASNEGTDTLSLKARLQNQEFLVPRGTFSMPTVATGESVAYSGLVENVAKFNGSTGSVRVANSTPFNSPTFSVEIAFQRAGNNPDNQMIFGKGSSDGNSFYLFSYRSLSIFNDFVVYMNGTRYDHQLGDVFALKTWYHVVLTLNGSEVTAFVNGQLAQTWRGAIRFEGNNHDFLIGNCVCGGYYFNGSIAFARFYDRSLAATDVLWNFENPMNPVGQGLTTWLYFNSAVNGIVSDLSHHGNTGIATGVEVVPPVSIGETYLVSIVARTQIGIEYFMRVSVAAR